eukprot:g9511.t1
MPPRRNFGKYLLTKDHSEFKLENFPCSSQRCSESLDALRKVGYEILDTADGTCSDSVGGVCQMRCENTDEAWESYTCAGAGAGETSSSGDGASGDHGTSLSAGTSAASNLKKSSWVTTSAAAGDGGATETGTGTATSTTRNKKIDLNRCGSPITLLLQDAMTKEAVNFNRIAEISIENEIYGKRVLQTNTKKLENRNKLVFTWQSGDVGQLKVVPKTLKQMSEGASKDSAIEFKPASQQYNEQFVAKDLSNPNRKMLLFLLDRKMDLKDGINPFPWPLLWQTTCRQKWFFHPSNDHGTVNEDCTFAGEVSSFRAVLWWSDYPKDLDLYATYTSCYDQIYDFEQEIVKMNAFESLYVGAEGQVAKPNSVDDPIEADAKAGPTADLWMWSLNPTPSYTIPYDMGLVVSKKGKPIYSRATGTGHPREFATDEFDELKKWYSKYPDPEKLQSFYVPFLQNAPGTSSLTAAAAASSPSAAGQLDAGSTSSGSDSNPGAINAVDVDPREVEVAKENQKHRAATGSLLRFFKNHPVYGRYADKDIREAGYDICPIASCSSRLHELKNGNKVAMFDKKNCVPTINQRSKWVSWISPLLMHLETAYERSYQHQGDSIGGPAAIPLQFPATSTSSSATSSGSSSSTFSSRLSASLQAEQERKRKLVEQGQLSKKMYEKFIKSMAMRKAKGNSRLELEVDHRDGFGPETITMTNVPPGLYKFGVHAFTEDMYLREATATVKFWFGDTVLIHCKLDVESCADPQYSDVRWWNVATVLVEPIENSFVHENPDGTTSTGPGPANGKDKKQVYRVKLLQNSESESGAMNKNKKQPLQWRDLPTREDVTPEFARSSRRRYYRRVELLYEEGEDSGDSRSNNWTLQKKTCTSKCWVEKGVADKCLG